MKSGVSQFLISYLVNDAPANGNPNESRPKTPENHRSISVRLMNNPLEMTRECVVLRSNLPPYYAQLENVTALRVSATAAGEAVALQNSSAVAADSHVERKGTGGISTSTHGAHRLQVTGGFPCPACRREPDLGHGSPSSARNKIRRRRKRRRRIRNWKEEIGHVHETRLLIGQPSHAILLC